MDHKPLASEIAGYDLTRRALLKFTVVSGSAGAAGQVGPWTALAVRQDGGAGTPDASPEADTSPVANGTGTLVQFSVGDTEIVVRTADNPTSHDFVSLLPLTLEFEDFNQMEKISDLPRNLTTDGSTGHTPDNGDLIYFVPWGNLGVFYDAERRDASFDDRVIHIGTVEAGFEFIEALETGPVTVDLIHANATPQASPSNG